MKRSRFSRRNTQTPAVETLIRVANALGQSSSRLEDGFWEAKLASIVDRLLSDNDNESIDAALDHLYALGARAYDELADMIEARAESHRQTTAGGEFDVLLIAAPLLAWSRYSIPAGEIGAAHLTDTRVQLQAHVLAADTRLGLADFLFSPDQLPQGYCETAALMEKLTKAALHGRDFHVDANKMPETHNFLSDTRYVLGVVVAARGEPMFRWQEDGVNRNDVVKHWRAQGGEAVRPLLTACAMEALLPQAYHAACREADRASRPYSVRASVAFLNTTLNVDSSKLRAIVAPYYDRQLEEYRIGFTLNDAAEVVHGIVWPMLEAEDDVTETPAQIESVLREAGVGEVILLDHRLPLEYCDDCGAPLYPNAEGEPVHAELPEQEASVPRHLH
jgi:hypothetical protein